MIHRSLVPPAPAHWVSVTGGWRHGKFAALCLAGVLARLGLYWWMARPFGGLTVGLCHMDCEFYLRIADGGYGVDAQFHDHGSYPNWAYFPLLPLTIRAMSAATGWPPALCGILIAHLALAAFLILGAAYLRTNRTAADPALWCFTVLTAPFGVFFAMPYTEAPLAALTAASLLLRNRKWPVAAAVAAALAAATRPTGILLAPLFAADLLRAVIRREPDWDRALLACAIAPFGLVIFMLWQYAAIGDALAFIHVQSIWSRQWFGPVTWIRLGLRLGDWREALDLFQAQSYSFSATAALLGLAAAAWLGLRRRWAEAWIAGAMILLPLSSGLHSMGRFVGTNPAVLLASYDIMKMVCPSARTALLLLMAGLQFALLAAWYGGAGGLF